jgi:hypothetical protein
MKKLKAFFTKSGSLGILFVVLLLLPMGWPVIILIMVISSFAAFGSDSEDDNK